MQNFLSKFNNFENKRGEDIRNVGYYVLTSLSITFICLKATVLSFRLYEKASGICYYGMEGDIACQHTGLYFDMVNNDIMNYNSPARNFASLSTMPYDVEIKIIVDALDLNAYITYSHGPLAPEKEYLCTDDFSNEYSCSVCENYSGCNNFLLSIDCFFSITLLAFRFLFYTSIFSIKF